MSTNTPVPVKALNAHEVMDLIRAGIVLVVTVMLAVLVPPKVWGAGEPERPAVQIQSNR